MTRATRTVEYTGGTPQVRYLAFELAIEEWKLGFTTLGFSRSFRPLRTTPTDHDGRCLYGGFFHLACALLVLRRVVK